MTTTPQPLSGNELDLLCDSTDRLLSRKNPLERLRENQRQARGSRLDADLWAELVGLGVPGLLVPSSLGGTGLGLDAAGRLLEVCGRHLVPEPVLSTVCLAIPLLSSVETEAARELLKKIVRDGSVVGVALPSTSELSGAEPPVAARRDGEWHLSGEYPFVLDAAGADALLVPATADEDGPSWFLVSNEASRLDGLLLDGRQASRIAFDGTRAVRAERLGSSSPGDALTEAFVVTGAVLVASWLIGVARRAFELTLDHLKTREQFGVSIGSFQALQHEMARLHCELIVAHSLVEAARLSIDAASPRAALMASAAKARIGRLSHAVTGTGIQYFGGMGMSAEADIGLFYKAARVGDLVAGHHLFHEARAGERLGIRASSVAPRVTGGSSNARE